LMHAEIALAGLASDGTHYFNKCLRHAAGHLMASPLRTEMRTATVLADHLACMPLSIVTSDHRAFKSTDAAACTDFTSMKRGCVGVQERMAVVWHKTVHMGHMYKMRFVAVTSSNVAKLFNVYPKKGRIAIGADADVVLWDASARTRLSCSTHASSADFSVYEGMTVNGGVTMTISARQIVYENVMFVTSSKPASACQFCPLQGSSPYLFSVVQHRQRVMSPEAVERTAADAAASSTNTAQNGITSSGSSERTRMNIGRVTGGDGARHERQPPGGKTTMKWD